MFDRLSKTLDSFRSDLDEEAAVDEATDEDGPGLGKRARSFATGRVILDEERVEGSLEELERSLIASDVEVTVAAEIIESVREELLGEAVSITTSPGVAAAKALRDALIEVTEVGQFDVDARLEAVDKPATILFTGVNGVGKTTTIAKLGRYLENAGYSVVLANGDTYRAGAHEQLEEHGDALGIRVIAHEQGGDPAAVLYDANEYAEANDIDFVLADTAGRLHTSHDLMGQLEKIGRVVDPAFTFLVDEAVAGQDAIRRAVEFDEAVRIDGTILTKADADTSGGAALSIAKVTGRPIVFLGTGQGYDDLERFDPEALVDRLLG